MSVVSPVPEAGQALYGWLDDLHQRAAKAMGVEDLGDVQLCLERDERESRGVWTQVSLRKLGNGVFEAGACIGKVNEVDGSMSGSDSWTRLNAKGEFIRPTSVYDAARIAIGVATVQSGAHVSSQGFGHLI